MARAFDDASTQYLEVAATPLGTDPNECTVSGWFKTDDLTTDQTIINICDSDQAVRYFSLQMGGNQYGDNVAIEVSPGGNAQSPSSASVNTWHHALFTQESPSTTNFYAYIDGSGGSVLNVAGVETWTMDTVAIGRNSDSTPSDYFSGSLAEIGVWNVKLDASEITALAKGFSPLLVRPQSLVLYVPLVRDNDKDLIGGVSFTASGSPTVDNHPKIIYPAPPVFYSLPAGAVGGRTTKNKNSHPLGYAYGVGRKVVS